ncbi:MAG: hypothetical protein Sylvanvirus35_6 [Sylvanvirus sp.]|uniref:Uncharacterized protein n=1 Tax=Sylvanvirus sp. TaxID=2487774 RepID=A0A3G5AJ79_9VIRU|nr:MAG: hypothetical protein Sylvanvirus35_6 [Sylvanvirus sp.]
MNSLRAMASQSHSTFPSALRDVARVILITFTFNILQFDLIQFTSIYFNSILIQYNYFQLSLSIKNNHFSFHSTFFQFISFISYK